MIQNSLFMKACRMESVERPPVWMMRQAGRYLPEYRAVRARHDFLTMCRTPELAAEVTLQPVDILGVDAAVIFSDILVVLEALGLEVTFEEGHGPKLARTITRADDLAPFAPGQIAESLSYVGESIRLVARELTPRGVPVLGFAGAPFTLTAYAIEGGSSREFLRTRKLLRSAPGLFSKILDVLAEAVAEHLIGQIEAGAAAVQIFDTWAGIFNRRDFDQFIVGSIQKTISLVQQKHSVPVIVYVKNSNHLIESLSYTGADVLSIDWRTPLQTARRNAGMHVALQGNLDPSVLYCPPNVIQDRTRKMLLQHKSPGYIANLGHGILPDVPPEHARTFIETVKGWRYE
ncbi:uroporphyrinogen decarboxylase [Kamptonema cortianum]|nr:uroporphyrinogen decarboxylase [Oscillatoria laete-virens]MDK3158016.1 uroporphyrinogen decarboxylase [Kamptonema cortianum]MDL5053107.1 uroporphyrinogen decarboxylase [Oscillatoria laete-virens NRMC-F 0139]